jgi:transcriptional regulator with XRE-family HTH domain
MNNQSNKRQRLGIRIKPKEGLWITYRLRLMGLKKKDMAERLGVCAQTVEQIINGKRSSRRIEEALRQTLGYPSFEDMIAASRGKPHNGPEGSVV